MTIPQIISSVGWSIFTIGLVFTIIHTLNVIVPGIDFFIRTGHLGWIGFLIGIPVTLFGFAIGVLGFFAERIEEWWLNKDRDDWDGR